MLEFVETTTRLSPVKGNTVKPREYMHAYYVIPV